MSDTLTFLAGGINNGNDLVTNHAWMFNWETQKWTRLNSMKYGRTLFGCGLYGNTVVVAGGETDPTSMLKSTEVFDLIDLTWSEGPDLPHDISSMGVSATKDRLVFSGGRQHHGFPGTFWMYHVLMVGLLILMNLQILELGMWLYLFPRLFSHNNFM